MLSTRNLAFTTHQHERSAKMPFHLTEQSRALIADMAVDKRGAIYGGDDLADYFGGAASMGELLVQRLTDFGELVILTDATTDTHYTARQLLDRGRRMANRLHARFGIRRNDRIAICTENRIEYVDILLGTLMLAATLAPMNPAHTERELEHACRLARPRVIFVERSAHAVALQRIAASCSIGTIVLFDRPESNQQADNVATTAPIIGYDDLMDAASTGDVDVADHPEPVDMRSTVALILYSSGTTGLPKGVRLTQLNSLLAVHRGHNRKRVDASPGASPPIGLSVMPFFHTYGLHVILTTVLFGGRLCVLRRFDAREYVRTIQRYGCTNLFVVPALMVFLAKSRTFDARELSSVRVIACNAAPLDATLTAAVRRRFAGNGPIAIRQGYGMTEMTLACTTQSVRCHTDGSVGELMIGVWGRVVDVQTGKVLGAGSEGEMQFKGNAMLDYVDNVEATRQMIGKDGWLRTGDVGYYTQEGEWFVVDRLKELIKYKGHQVAPAEIEGVLLQMEQVTDAAVIGVADERAGEVPMAFVVRATGELSVQSVQEFVRERMTAGNWLRGGVRFVEHIPRTKSGKILRKELRNLVSSTKKAKL